MVWFLFSGLSLGVAAGISPGPLLALLVSQTLRHGLREGAKVAIAPLLSDLPIVLACVLAVRSAANLGASLAWISILGGGMVAYLGYDCLRADSVPTAAGQAAPRSILKAAGVNLLNPHVYLFWVTVGAPMLLNGWRRGDGSAVAFAAGFYASLVGSKVVVAVAVNRSRDALGGARYTWTMRVMGTMLLAVAAWMLASGVTAAR